MKNATWSGPREVPLDTVDVTHRKRWNAWHEPDRVAKFARRITKRAKQGRRIKPVVLVDTPATEPSTNLKVIDGHHRTLAYRHSKMPVWAYVGKVDQNEGPWDELHAQQRAVDTRATADDDYGAKSWSASSIVKVGPHGYVHGWIYVGAPDVTSAERAAVAEHAASSYGLNSQLRTGKLINDDQRQRVHLIDSALSKSALSQDTDVYRGLSAVHAENLKPGSTVSDPAYQSFSVNQHVADMYGEKILHVKLPAGTHAVPGGKREQELILPRSTQLIVDSVFGDQVEAHLLEGSIAKSASWLAWEQDRDHADALAQALQQALAAAVDTHSIAQEWSDIVARQAPGPGAAESYVMSRAPQIRQALESALGPAWQSAWELGEQSAQHQLSTAVTKP